MNYYNDGILTVVCIQHPIFRVLPPIPYWNIIVLSGAMAEDEAIDLRAASTICGLELDKALRNISSAAKCTARFSNSSLPHSLALEAYR